MSTSASILIDQTSSEKKFKSARNKLNHSTTDRNYSNNLFQLMNNLMELRQVSYLT